MTSLQGSASTERVTQEPNGLRKCSLGYATHDAFK